MAAKINQKLSNHQYCCLSNYFYENKWIGLYKRLKLSLKNCINKHTKMKRVRSVNVKIFFFRKTDFFTYDSKDILGTVRVQLSIIKKSESCRRAIEICILIVWAFFIIHEKNSIILYISSFKLLSWNHAFVNLTDAIYMSYFRI